MEWVIAVVVFAVAVGIFYITAVRKGRKLPDRPHEDDGFDPEWPDGEPDDPEPPI